MKKKTVSISIVVALGLSIFIAYVLASAGNKPSVESPYITEYVLPTPDSAPLAIAVDATGGVWVATSNTTLVLFRPVSETFSEFKIPTDVKASSVWGMAIDRDGTVWFTSQGDNSVWSFDPAEESFKQYSLPTPNAFPIKIALDEDGNVWFTELYGGKLGRIQPLTGEIIEYEPPSKDSGPGDLLVGPEGDIWFAEGFANKIARFDPKTETFVELEPSQPILSPTSIVMDRYEGVWFVEHGGSLFGRFVPLNGSIVKYATSSSAGYPISLPYWLAIDESGDIWFNQHTGNKIARFDPLNEILVEYQLPKGHVGGLVNALQFSIAPDGKVWFTEFTENKIGVIDTSRRIPFDLSVEPRKLSILPEEPVTLKALVSGSSSVPIQLNVSSTFSFSGRFLNAVAKFSPALIPPFNGDLHVSDLNITLRETLSPGDYVVAVSASDGFAVHSVMVHLKVTGKG